MAKTKKEIIKINEKDLSLKEILKQGADAPIEAKITASVILDDQIARLKAVADRLKEEVKSSKYDEVVKKLTAEGKISSIEAAPVVEISTITGDIISVSMSGGVDSNFDCKELSEKAVMDSLVPDKYKKITTTLDKKAIEADFDDGTLPDILKGYCSKAPTEILKLRKSIKSK